MPLFVSRSGCQPVGRSVGVPKNSYVIYFIIIMKDILYKRSCLPMFDMLEYYFENKWKKANAKGIDIE